MIRLCTVEELRTKGVLRIDGVVGLKDSVVLVYDGGKIFCVDDSCTHQDASLSEGWIEDGCIECPLHESRFDLQTGWPDGPPARDPVRTHRVEVRANDVVLLDGLDGSA